MKTSAAMFKWWMAPVLATVIAMAAAEDATPPPLRLSLVSEVSAIQAGKAFAVGIYLQHAAHHHSYYKFPGIVGVPTNVTWDLPPGFTAGPLQWPTPERVDMRGHGAYGYHEDTLLIAQVTPPPNLATGKTVRLAGKVGYLCCSQQACTPGFKDLELGLTVGERSVRDDQWHPRFEKARSRLPVSIKGWQAEVEETGTHFFLALRPPDSLPQDQLPKPEDLYFFSWNGWTASNKLHDCQWNDDHFQFTMPKHPYPEKDAKRFQGVIRCQAGWPATLKATLGMWIDVPLPKRPEE